MSVRMARLNNLKTICLRLRLLPARRQGENMQLLPPAYIQPKSLDGSFSTAFSNEEISTSNKLQEDMQPLCVFECFSRVTLYSCWKNGSRDCSVSSCHCAPVYPCESFLTVHQPHQVQKRKDRDDTWADRQS